MSMKKTTNKRQASESEYGEIVSLENALEYFCTQTKAPGVSSVKMRGNVTVKHASDIIHKASNEHGLRADDIDSLVDAVISARLPKTISHGLLKDLIPADVVAENTVVKLISWMCTNQPAADTQSLIIRWLLIILDDIDKTGLDRLRQLYGFLFLMLDNSVLCPHLCHLLYRITCKEHVRPFRVRALLRLQSQLGSRQKSPVMGLLSMYKQYQPHLVVVSVTSSRKVFFRATDRVWIARVRQVTSRRGPLLGPSMQPALPQNNVQSSQQSKRTKLDVVPKNVEPVQIADLSAGSRKTSCLWRSRKQMVPCSQITDMNKLVKCIGRIELSRQIVPMVCNSVLRYVVALSPDPSTLLRLEYWLQHTLFEEFQNVGATSESRQAEVLKLAVDFSEFIQEGIPACDNFLATYILVWNGFTHREHILKLLTRLSPQLFEVFCELYLEPLRKLFFSSSVYFKCQLLITWTELLINWSRLDYHRHRRRMEERVRQMYTTVVDDDAVSDVNYLFKREYENFSTLDFILDFIKFVDKVAVIGLQQERFSVLLTHFVLQFFEEVSRLFVRYQVPVLHVPSAGIVYGCLFHRNAMPVSRIIAIICQCRQSYQALRRFKASDAPAHTKASLDKVTMQQLTQRLNSYTVDMCDMLWRCWSFTDKQSDNTVLRLIPESTLKKLNLSHPSMALSVFMHRAMLGYSFKFLSVTQSPGVVVDPASIKKHKDVFVEFLSQRHVEGIQQFINMCINRRDPSTIQSTISQESRVGSYE